jgi:hypothetical protein
MEAKVSARTPRVLTKIRVVVNGKPVWVVIGQNSTVRQAVNAAVEEAGFQMLVTHGWLVRCQMPKGKSVDINPIDRVYPMRFDTLHAFLDSNEADRGDPDADLDRQLDAIAESERTALRLGPL